MLRECPLWQEFRKDRRRRREANVRKDRGCRYRGGVKLERGPLGTYAAPAQVLTSGVIYSGICSSRNRGSCPCGFRGVDLLLYHEVVQEVSE